MILLAIAGLSAGGAGRAAAAQRAQQQAAQQANPAHTHIGHVLDAFTGTPNGQGLLPTAVAEAKIVAQHAALAAGDLANLEAMKRHAGHILHAVDPAESASGPGLGYGLKKAAANAATHVGLAARSEGASQNMTAHSAHVTASLQNTVQRTDQILALAKRIQAAGSAAEAATLVTTLNAIAAQLVAGVDLNGDGRIGWHEGEGGLQQAEQHMNLLKQGEARSGSGPDRR
jgi:hypothetical protein